GAKIVLNLHLEPGGLREAEQVLETLAAHPSAARFVAAKLARRFVADEPPPALAARAADVFLRTNGDLRVVLRTILLDSLDQIQPKYKRPAHFVASALRMLNAEAGGGALHEYLARLGQAYF